MIEKGKLLRDEAELLKNETNIMKALSHEGMIALHESFETLEYLYYVIELVDGIDLFRHVANKIFLDEIDASYIMYKILNSV